MNCERFAVMMLSSAADDDEIPQELLLGKHQLSELGSESAKIKAMGITFRVRPCQGQCYRVVLGR